MDLDLDELEATRNKSADKMFEELGYTQIEKSVNGIEYINENDDKIIGFIDYDNYGKVIDFDIFEKIITMQELKAINKKVEELRLVESRCKYVKRKRIGK